MKKLTNERKKTKESEYKSQMTIATCISRNLFMYCDIEIIGANAYFKS